jgi:hypothetical protein
MEIDEPANELGDRLTPDGSLLLKPPVFVLGQPEVDLMVAPSDYTPPELLGCVLAHDALRERWADATASLPELTAARWDPYRPWEWPVL